MAAGDNASSALRPWIAPALGLGLLVAGIALGLGLRSGWAPFVTVAVAAIVLLFGQWRTSHRTATPDDDVRSPSD